MQHKAGYDYSWVAWINLVPQNCERRKILGLSKQPAICFSCKLLVEMPPVITFSHKRHITLAFPGGA
jgi:hypothetical protein